MVDCKVIQQPGGLISWARGTSGGQHFLRLLSSQGAGLEEGLGEGVSPTRHLVHSMRLTAPFHAHAMHEVLYTTPRA